MKKQVFGYLHTHWDIEWYRDIEDFNLRFLDVFDIVLDELKNNRAPFFYLDGQCMALLEYLKYRPNKKEKIKELIKQNKLAIGPFLVSADSYLINFQSMLKNIKYGLEISKEFEQKDFIGYMSDIFGVSNSIFEALKLNNIKNAIIWRGVNPKKIKNNCNFIKNGINTTWLIQGYFNDFFHQETPNIEGIKNYLDKISKYSKDALLLPIGADHLGMLKNANEKIKFVNSKLDNYEIILTNPFEYFKKTNFINSTNEKEFLDNSNTFILQGVYSARIVQKIKNNEIQNELSRIIEPFNYFLNEKFQPNIDELYKTLIKNHAHDGIYGCSIDSVHRTINSRQEKIKNSINAIKKRFIGNFKKAQEIKGNSTNKIGLFNLSNIKNLKTIQVDLPYKLKNSQIIKTKKSFSDDLFYDIYKIPVTEDITNIYTQLIEITNNNCYEFSVVNIKKAKKKTIVSNNSIENEKIKLEIIDKNIIITNKKSLETFELKITDIKDIGDSYNFAPSGKYKKIELLKTKINYDGEIESSLKLYFKNIELDATINNDSDFIKFKTKINNKTKNHKLQLVLLSKNNISKTISQDAMGIIERKIDFNYKMQDYMPAKRPFELKTNSYPMQNFVCANNIIAITKGLHEYEIYKNELRICLLRCFSTISNPKNPTRAIPAGPDLKTPEAQLIETINSEFILTFGNYKKAFKTLDNIFKNYIIIDGDLEKCKNFKLKEIPDNNYIYGLHENKIIAFDYNKNKLNMI